MAFHSLSHKMSVPQHSSEPTPQHLERGSHEQFLFRQREKEDEKEDVCGSNLRSLVQSGKELGGGGGEGKNGAPTWLSSAILRQQNQQYAAEGGGREEGRKWCGCCEPGSRGCVQCSFLNLTAAPSNSAAMPAQWLPRAFRRGSEVLGEDVTPAESMMALSHGSADVKNQSARAGLVDLQSSDTANSGDLPVDSGGGGGEREADDGNDNHAAGLWQNAKFKADILSHPLYEQLLSAHVACLRIATPVDQLPRIDAQLAQSQHVVSKYSLLASNNNLLADEKELDQFMVSFLSFLLKLPLETDPFAIALICEIYLAFICTLSVEISLRCLIFIVFPFSNLTSNCVFWKKSGNL